MKQDKGVKIMNAKEFNEFIRKDKLGDNGIEVTKEMMDQAKETLARMEPSLRDEKYLNLKDFVETFYSATIIHKFHVVKIAWVFCPELNGEDFCHIFGQKEHQCPVASIPGMDERMGLPECPIFQDAVEKSPWYYK